MNCLSLEAARRASELSVNRLAAIVSAFSFRLALTSAHFMYPHSVYDCAIAMLSLPFKLLASLSTFQIAFRTRSEARAFQALAMLTVHSLYKCKFFDWIHSYFITAHCACIRHLSKRKITYSSVDALLTSSELPAGKRSSCLSNVRTRPRSSSYLVWISCVPIIRAHLRHLL